MPRRLGWVVLVVVLGCCLAAETAPEGMPKDTDPSPEPESEIKGVEDLMEASADEVLGTGKLWLVKFFKAECPACDEIATEFDEAVIALEGEVRMAEVDVGAEPGLARRFGVKTLPTILAVLAGERVFSYSGSLTKDGMLSFAMGGYEEAEIAYPYPPGPPKPKKVQTPPSKEQAPPVEEVKEEEEAREKGEEGEDAANPVVAAPETDAEGEAEGDGNEAPEGEGAFVDEEIPELDATEFLLPGSKHIVDLGMKNFEESIQDDNVWIIMFYVHWCAFSRQMAPDFARLANRLAQSEGIRTGRIDGILDLSENNQGERLGIEGFPAVVAVANGHVYNYAGEKSLEEMYRFATGGFSQQKSRPLPPPGTTAKENEEDPEGGEGMSPEEEAALDVQEELEFPKVEDVEGTLDPMVEYTEPAKVIHSEGSALPMYSWVSGPVLRVAFFVPRRSIVDLKEGEGNGEYTLTVSRNITRQVYDGEGRSWDNSTATFLIPDNGLFRMAGADELMGGVKRLANEIYFQFFSESTMEKYR